MKIALLVAFSCLLLSAAACQKARNTDGEKQMGPSPTMGSGSTDPLAIPSGSHEGGPGAGAVDAGHTRPR